MSRCAMTVRLLVLVLGFCSASLADEAFKLTPQLLESIAEQTLPWVESELGAKAGKRLRFRLVDRDEMGEVLAKELAAQFLGLPQPSGRETSPGEAKIRAEVSAGLLKGVLLAKYAPEKDEILFCAGNFRSLAALLEMPDLNTEDGVRVIAIHEGVHAVSNAKYGWSKLLTKMGSEARLEAFSSVIEGHAQHVSRRVSKAKGLAKAFDLYTRAVGALPPDLDEGARLSARIMTAGIVAQYVDGEKFVASILKSEGEPALARAYSNPPIDLDAIVRPEWFLDPESRPVLEFDFESALKLFSDSMKGVWTTTNLTLTTPQIDAALGLLPKAERDLVTKRMVHNRGVRMNPLVFPAGKLAVAVVYEFESHKAARYYTAAAEKLSRIKEKELRTGTVRILESKIVPLDDGLQGTRSSATVSVGGQETEVLSVIAYSGKILIEILLSSHVVERADLEKTIRLMFEKATKVKEPKPGESSKSSADKDEEKK